MTRFNVDLKTKIISDDTKVYFARAGENGHLLDQVWKTKSIGPDLPGLGLDISNGFRNDLNIVSKINRSRAIRRWCKTPRNRRDPARPTMNLGSYSNTKRSSGHFQFEYIAKSYFEEMKKGDVLVIPGPNIVGDALLVELLPLPDKMVRIPGSGRYEGFDFDARPFGHVQRVPMTELPRHIIEISRKPGAVAALPQPLIRNRIFDLTFNDYSLDDVFSSRISTTKPDFRPFDANVLNAFLQMIAHNVAILEDGGPEHRLIGLSEAAFRMADDDSLEVKIEIHSPGYLSMIARSLTPLVAGAVLAVLTSVSFDPTALAQTNLEIVVANSKIDRALDVCSQPVSQLTQDLLRFLPEDKFREMCDLLQETTTKTGASTSVTATPKSGQ